MVTASNLHNKIKWNRWNNGIVLIDISAPQALTDEKTVKEWMHYFNGEMKQNGNTKNMIFSPSFLVHYLSQFMLLEAGDVLSTGTPAGVGAGMTPPQFLRNGDVVELSIEKLGTQKQTFKAYQTN